MGCRGAKDVWARVNRCQVGEGYIKLARGNTMKNCPGIGRRVRVVGRED